MEVFMRLAVALLVSALGLMLIPPPAGASRYVRYGIQDDAWVEFGPGKLEDRLDRLDRLGVELVRFTLRWDRIAARKPANGRHDVDPSYAWGNADAILRGLHARGIAPVVTIWGTPRWANRGRSANWAPTSKWTFAAFAYAAAKRYPFVRHWLIWNEPNQRRWFRPTAPQAYVQLLNVAYIAIKKANRRARIGAGVTAPRGNRGGVSPVDWIRGMRRARARLDAYAHHPYPTTPTQTPWRGACGHCSTITMASLERLLREVARAWGAKRVWLTEYGYQSNPPDRFLGVSKALQARYVGSASRRVYAAPRVDMLIHFLYRDDTRLAGWQSGLIDRWGSAKPAYRAFRLPLSQIARRGLRTVVWSQVRNRTGRQPYVLQQHRAGRWQSVGGRRWTDQRGFLRRTIRTGSGSRLRIWSPRDGISSPALVIR
jgi:hypothetical protein